MLFFYSIFRSNLESSDEDLNIVTEETINVNKLYNIKLKV